MKDYSKQIAEGMHAFSNNNAQTVNPYANNTEMFKAFQAGYEVAKFMNKPVFIGIDENDIVKNYEKKLKACQLRIEELEEEREDVIDALGLEIIEEDDEDDEDDDGVYKTLKTKAYKPMPG